MTALHEHGFMYVNRYCILIRIWRTSSTQPQTDEAMEHSVAYPTNTLPVAKVRFDSPCAAASYLAYEVSDLLLILLVRNYRLWLTG